MTIPKINDLVEILLLALVLLGLALFVLRQARKRAEDIAREEIAKNDASLVGMKTIAVTELRPNISGEIRLIFSPEKEREISLAGEERQGIYQTYSAVSSQYISKGRMVVVTGGDTELYRVRAAAGTFLADK